MRLIPRAQARIYTCQVSRHNTIRSVGHSRLVLIEQRDPPIRRWAHYGAELALASAEVLRQVPVHDRATLLEERLVAIVVASESS